MRELHQFDWPRFWLQEVILLGGSMLLMVMTSHEVPPLSGPRLALLLVVLLGLTMFNVIQNRVGKVRLLPHIKRSFHQRANSK